MPVARPRSEDPVSAAPAAPPEAGQTAPRAPAREQADPLAPARLADELAIPAPSPVHRMQAELAQLAAPAPAGTDLPEEAVYPGWFRVCFPLAASALLWTAIAWGISRVV